MPQKKNQAGRPMSTTAPVDTDLHLPDLHIKGFRGINDLKISRLGRVTLLAGKNGVGKTTVLDAVRVYAARGRYATLSRLLLNREEIVVGTDNEENREILVPSWLAMFHGRVDAADWEASIGPVTGDQLTIHAKIVPGPPDPFPELHFLDEVLLVQVSFQGSVQEFPTLDTERQLLQSSRFSGSKPPPVVSCESLGPGLLSNRQLARYWDRVALTDEESRAVDALNLIYSNRVERVAMIGHTIGDSGIMGRSPVVKLCHENHTVPLKSLGDGAVRLFGVALALANGKDGFLLIDEAENGIHHSIQRDFWTMILKAAHQNNVQVLATTHSWDCVAGFAMAATEIEEVDGALVRLDRYDDRIRSVEYTEDDLRIAAKHGIEVR